MSRAAHWLAVLGGAAIMLAAVMVAIDVIVRWLFGAIPLRSFEISTYIFAASTAFGFSYALIERKHIRIDAIYMMLPARLRPIMDLAALVVLTAAAGVLAYHAALTAFDSFELNATSTTTLQAPLAVPQGLWALGLIWFAATAAALVLRAGLDLLRGRAAAVAARIGMPRAQSDL